MAKFLGHIGNGSPERPHLAKERLRVSKSGKQVAKNKLRCNAFGAQKTDPFVSQKAAPKCSCLQFEAKKWFEKRNRFFCPIPALSRKILGSTVSADRRLALRTPQRARQRAAHLLTVLRRGSPQGSTSSALLS